MTIQSWKLTLACTKAEAQGIAGAELGDTVALITTEEDEAAERWRLDAYFEGEPDPGTIAEVHALVPSAAGHEAVPEPVPDEDWVALSQAGLEPVRAGRFFVHTSAHADAVPEGVRAFHIEAGRAFGTGHHETTAGCLETLDALEREGARFAQMIDLGTGTGVLAFAALALWPDARATATDIDAVAIEVSRINAEVNAVAVGQDAGQVALIVADGTDDPQIAERASYDLIVANILAPPLIAMAHDVAAIAQPGATIVLAGLLTRQAESVEAAYAAAGCETVERLVRGDWTILRLRHSTQSSPRSR